MTLPRSRHPRARLALAGVLALTGGALANDSASELAAGGLVLVKTPGIAMQREDLTLSESSVRVRYEMRNDTGKATTLRIAFPMPDVPAESPAGLTTAGGGHNIAMQVPDHPDFLRFRVRVEGKDIAPEVEIKAIMPDGRDIAAELRRIGGVKLTMRSGVFLRDMDKGGPDDAWFEGDRPLLDPAIRRALRDLGAIEMLEGSAGYRLPWTTRITFHWMQDFKPGVTVVEHDYKPIVGERMAIAERGKPIIVSGTEDATRDFCIDAPTDRAIRAAAAAVPRPTPAQPAPILAARTLGYILKTATNWQGSIGTFHLTIEGGAVTSLCTDLPLKKTGPRRFEATVRDYVPKDDLRVLFVKQP